MSSCTSGEWHGDFVVTPTVGPGWQIAKTRLIAASGASSRAPTPMARIMARA
jgi:hypothetical protein